jgi:hypothetical protein
LAHSVFFHFIPICFLTRFDELYFHVFIKSLIFLNIGKIKESPMN